MPKSYDFTFFSQKCKYDFLHTLFFSATIVICTGMKTKEHSFSKLSTLSQKKIKGKGGARFLAFSIAYSIGLSQEGYHVK